MTNLNSFLFTFKMIQRPVESVETDSDGDILNDFPNLIQYLVISPPQLRILFQKEGEGDLTAQEIFSHLRKLYIESKSEEESIGFAIDAIQEAGRRNVNLFPVPPSISLKDNPSNVIKFVEGEGDGTSSTLAFCGNILIRDNKVFAICCERVSTVFVKTVD